MNGTAQTGTRPRIRLWGGLILLGGLAIRLAIVSQDVDFLTRNGPLIDDSFLAFSVARNIALGHGATADGVIPTSGYQPFWVYLMVPFFVLFPGADDRAIASILGFSAILSVATGLVLFRFLRDRSGVRAGLVGVLVWQFHPLVLRQTLNGLETGLAAFFLLAVLACLERVTRPPRYDGLPLLWLCLAGFLFARIDGVLILPGLLIVLRRVALPGRRILAGLAAALSPIAAWSLVNLVRLGEILPESGRAVRLISLCYGGRFNPEGGFAVSPERIPLAYYAGNVLATVIAVERYILSLLQPFFDPFSLNREPEIRFVLFPGLLTVMLAAGVILFRRRFAPSPPRPESPSGDLTVPVMASFSILLVAAYCTWGFGQWFYQRYYFPLFVFLLIGGASLLGPVLQRLGQASLAGSIVFPGLCLWLAVSLGFHAIAWLRPAPQPVSYLEVVDWLERNNSQRQTIGCFQAGIIGFRNRTGRTVCLDGVVNGRARRALESKTIDRYIARERIGLIIDWPWVIESLLHNRSAAGAFESDSWAPITGLPLPFVGLQRKGGESRAFSP